MSAVMAEHITSNTHHDPAVGMHYMWNGSVDVSDIWSCLNIIMCVRVRNIFLHRTTQPKRKKKKAHSFIGLRRVFFFFYLRKILSIFKKINWNVFQQKMNMKKKSSFALANLVVFFFFFFKIKTNIWQTKKVHFVQHKRG